MKTINDIETLSEQIDQMTKKIADSINESMTMYDRIRELRIKEGLSQEELAKKTGYSSRSMISRIENGEVDLSQSKIKLMASTLHTTTDYLMDGTTQSDPYSTIVSEEDLETDENKKILFRLAKKAKPEAIRAAVAVLKSMEETNHDF